MNVMKNSFCMNGEDIFCGIENYKAIYQNEAFRLALKNTVILTIASILIVLFLSLGLSFFLFNLGKTGHIFQILNLFPMTVPVTSVALFWSIMFDKQGIWNGTAAIFGGGKIDWIHSEYAMIILILIFIWKNIGFITLLWMIGLSSIPNQIYEAARVDGAGRFRIFFSIALPNMRQTLYISIIFLMVKAAQIYREAYIIAGDYPAENMYLLQHIFHNWFRSYDFGKLSAGAVIYAIIITFLVLGLRRLDKTV